jgi:hypothetical protein
MKHLLIDAIKASNKLTLRYRNTIAFPALMHDESETPVGTETILAILTEARTLQEYGYYIHPLDIIIMIRRVVTEADGAKVVFSLKMADDYLAEVTGATRTYKTLYGAHVTAEDLRNAGVDPYMVQYVHYTMVYLGADDHESYNILDSAASEQAAQSVSKAITNEQYPGQKENLEALMNALVNNIEGKERLFISFDMIHDATAIFTELVGSNNPMSDTMKSDVRRFLEYVASDIEDWDKKEIEVPCKETFAMLVYEYLRLGFNATNLVKNINNATDALRAFAVYSDPTYDGSLTTKPKFKNHLNHDERKFFMILLTHAEHVDTDVFLYPEMWKRAFERLKPQQFLHKRFKKVREAADNLYHRKKPQTVKGIAEKAVLHAGDSLKDFESGLKKLEMFPGTYMRYFDKYVRTYGSKISDDLQENRHFQHIVTTSLYRVVSQVESTKMLCQLLILYQNRRHDENNTNLRYIKPKGSRAYVPLKPTAEPLCDKTYLNDFYDEIVNILRNEVTRRFKDKPYLGKVFIDEAAWGVVVPTELREANDSGLHIVGRGSYFRLPTVESAPEIAKQVHDIIVPYIHWTNGKDGMDDRVDLDLSGSFYTDDFKYVGKCSYGNLCLSAGSGEDRSVIATHSGDFTSGGPYDGPGVAEYLIVRRKDAVEKLKARYLVIHTHVYTGQDLANTNAFFGFEYLQERNGEQQLEQYAQIIHGGQKDMACKSLIRPDRTLFTSNLRGKEDSMINVVIDLVNSVAWYADLATRMIGYDYATEYNYLDAPVEQRQGTEDKTPFKAYINTSPKQNNVDGTKLSELVQIKALLEKPYLYCGDLMWLHGEVRGHIVRDPKKADVIFTLPDSRYAKDADDDQEIITPFMTDRILDEFMPVK